MATLCTYCGNPVNPEGHGSCCGERHFETVKYGIQMLFPYGWDWINGEEPEWFDTFEEAQEELNDHLKSMTEADMELGDLVYNGVLRIEQGGTKDA